MRFILEVFAVVALLSCLGAHAYLPSDIRKSKAEGGLLIDSADLLFDAIFNSSDLSRYEYNGTNYDYDLETQICLHVYTLRNIVVLKKGGEKLRDCVQLSDEEVKDYLQDHNLESMKTKFGHEAKACMWQKSESKKEDCIYKVTLKEFNKILRGNVSDNYKNHQCVHSEMSRIVRKLNLASDSLVECVFLDDAAAPDLTDQEQHQWNSSDSTNNTIPWFTSAPWNDTGIFNSTFPPMTFAPWNDTGIFNSTFPPMTFAPWNNTGSSNGSIAHSPNQTIVHWTTTASSKFSTTTNLPPQPALKWWQKIWRRVKEII